MHLTKILAAAAGTTLLAAAQSALPAAHDAARDADSTFAWGDFDGDGLADAFVVQPGAEGRLLRNAGDGGFEDVTARAGLTPDAPTALARWADYDADGRLDLFLGAERGASTLWRNRGDGSFEPATGLAGVAAEGRVLAARWLDYDGDGRLDLLVRTALERELFHNAGSGTFEAVDLGLPAAPAGVPVALDAPRVDAPSDAAPAATTVVRASGALAAAPLAGPALDAPDRRGGGGRVEASVTDVQRGPSGVQGMGTGLCVDGLFDQGGGGCVNASRTPTLDMLFPMSLALNVNAATDHVGIGDTTPDGKLEVRQTTTADILNLYDGGANVVTVLDGGNVGIGETSPRSRLHVGGPNDEVSGPTIELTGDSGNQFEGGRVRLTELGSFLGGYLHYDAAGNLLNLGTHGVTSTSAADDVDAISIARSTEPSVGVGTTPTSTVVLNVLTDDGDEGLRVTSTSTGFGGRFQATNASNSLPALSTSHVGSGEALEAVHSGSGLAINATNTAGGSAARFQTTASGNVNPAVDIDHNGLGVALDVTSTLNGNAARFSKTSTTSTASTVSCDNDGDGVALFASQSDLSSLAPAVDVRSFSNVNMGLRVISNNSGDGMLVFCNDTSGTGNGIDSIVRGSGVAGAFESSTGTTVTLNRTDNAGNIFEAANSTDIEFRVESSGNVFCDGSFTGGGADYAEWLERADYEEVLEAGDVVGVRGGRITKDLTGAEQILVISSNPALVGNAAGAEESARDGFEVTAFLGQVPVKVLGAVASGDFLVPSGRDDGTAVAVAPTALDFDDLGRVFAVAWEGSDAEGMHLVNAAVGLDQAAAVEALVGRLHAELERRDAAVADLGAQVANLLDRVAAIESDRAPVARR